MPEPRADAPRVQQRGQRRRLRVELLDRGGERRGAGRHQARWELGRVGALEHELRREAGPQAKPCAGTERQADRRAPEPERRPEGDHLLCDAIGARGGRLHGARDGRREWRLHRLVLLDEEEPRRRRRQGVTTPPHAARERLRAEPPGGIEHDPLACPRHALEGARQARAATAREHDRRDVLEGRRHRGAASAGATPRAARAAASTAPGRTSRMQSSVPRGQLRPPWRPHGRQARSASTTTARGPQGP